MKKKKKIWIIVIIVVGIIVILAVAKMTGIIGKKASLKIATEKVEKRTIIETVSASGKIQPEVEVKISPDVSGEVVELNVKEGDKVKKGDLLAKINPDIYISSLDRMVATLNAQKASQSNASARLAQVKAQYVNAQASFDRNDDLFKKGVISQSEYDAAKAAYEVAKQEVKAAEESFNAAQYTVASYQASVKEASDNLHKTSIFAPVDGTISKLNVEKGERVVGTTQFAGTEIMRIADLNEMEVNVSVNENDIVRVNLNDTALVEVDAYLNRKFKGIVTEIANTANSTTGVTTDQVTNFEVKIRILRSSYEDLIPKDRPDLSPFRPGMSATVDIQTETVVNVLSLPIQSVTTRQDTTKKDEMKPKDKDEPEGITKIEGDHEVITAKDKKGEVVDEYVFIYSEGKVKMQKVKSGIQDNLYIQIKEGLKTGDEVVSAPYTAINRKLKNGDKVEKVDKKDLFAEKEE
jgi:HlyD family secretion protein